MVTLGGGPPMLASDSGVRGGTTTGTTQGRMEGSAAPPPAVTAAGPICDEQTAKAEQASPAEKAEAENLARWAGYCADQSARLAH